ncbi:restriction endonuclease [Nocardia sp. NPDC058114]|uniref:restriction endonuclease n=1 Tax=Nocardia sp. NPDC058114 TaxID=3346346 RepID=UPI0036D88FD5
MNWDDLDWETFEALVALLMQGAGFVITSPPGKSRGPDGGVDFVARSTDQRDVYVQAKHSRRPLSSSQLRSAADTARRLNEQLPDAEFFFVSSTKLRAEDRHALTEAEVTVWDRADIDRQLLNANPDVAQRIQETAKARDLSGLFAEAGPCPESTLASRVAKELAAIPRGHAGWRTFEKEAARILTEIFLPDLGPPDTQVRTADGLDIMDATYPIAYVGSSWSDLRTQFQTRFVVAEFKNHTDPIGQHEVKSIAQYLFHRAFRMFGLLVSRTEPSASAEAERRKAWMEPDFERGKMIVFLSDEDLVQMAQYKDDGRDPYQVIDQKLTAFLITLSP